ncbi:MULTISPECIES: acetamidase/formamidase family protein [Halorubrum]|jgi:amidase|uniref:Acetamidase n=1 Tax=Halorubrum ezzemoulense TaxID=337243 RepID=A0A256JRV9_HALEZ|nr:MULTISPECIES: acetamidase/formamidase family protein [Halorubrum]MDB2224084.1 acetamidase/formamidase family protein [Halorubrum ezzemoulense]MDB2264074.1 acetamidase/formamidase family protein [Halorubrum ezzemoulense]MDB2269442.1 acetamidase/formamidase family protein [Halorubrum ezzemoulense]MDB2274779.1 acetamidase/formamidase family protein [Halorubrum ezzemoulense]MDB9279914.1 acetamidase/formamidase family protein [Halorubrum ezzemoulense]
MTRETVSHRDGHVYEFGPEMDPVYEAADGESLTVETIDSLNGEIQRDDDLLDAIPEEVNAATGPIAVAGASPGDVLAVEIEAVRVAEDRGRVLTAPGFGLLQDDPEIDHPATRITEVDADESEAGAVEFEGIDVPIEPVIGTIGVATGGGTVSTLTPDDHGGNLDTTDVTGGTTVYFPVFQEGAMLALGDAKAAMADGEMCGTGAEIAVEVDATLSVVEDPAVPLDRPLLDTGDAVKTLASAETLEGAVELANADMLDLLAHHHGFSRTEAYLFSSLVGGLEISQVVDPQVTARNAVPSEYLSVPF